MVFVDVPRDDDVMVILKGTQLDGLSYSIMVHPPARNITRLQESTSFELSLSYNTTYNVSVVPSFCDERGAPTVFNLYFGELANIDSCSPIYNSI